MLLCVALAKAADDEPNIGAGQRFAQKHCGSCHAIGPTGDSPFKDAPPFRDFAKLWPVENIEEALAEGIVVGHEAMPEFELSPRQIADLIGYLKTLEPVQ
jgi:mono/diheme cytochrome c family protein